MRNLRRHHRNGLEEHHQARALHMEAIHVLPARHPARRDAPRLPSETRSQHEVLEGEGRLSERRSDSRTESSRSRHRGTSGHQLQDRQEARADGISRRHRHPSIQGDSHLQANVRLHHQERPPMQVHGILAHQTGNATPQGHTRKI